MRISKKILSIVLAVLMLVSVCMVPSSAATALDGTEDASKINVKYEVTQPESIYDGALEAVDGNIYAVTVYAKAAYGINVLQVPLYFDKDKFAPIMWEDDDPWGNEAAGVEGWYENNGEALVYDFGKGEAWSDTSWYRTNGNTASSTGNARFIGLGNSNVTAPLMYKAEYVESTNTEIYDAYTGSPDDNFDGYMYCFFLNNQSKTAYMNGIANAVKTDYVSMMTIYFIRQEGVTAEDCVGAQFGWAEGGDWLTQTTWDTSGSPSYFASTYVEGKPGAKYVSNAVVEEAAPAYSETTPTIISNLKTQMRFNPKNSANLDVRNLAVIDGDALNVYLNDAELLANYTATATQTQQEQLAAALIKDIGFIYSASTETTIDRDDAILWHQGLESTQTYAKKTVSFIDTSTSAGNYVISCMVDNINADDCQTYHLVSLGYLVLDTDFDGTADTYYYYQTVNSTDLADLYGNRPA